MAGGLPTAVLLTPEEAAARLGVSRASAYRLIETGRLRAVRIGITGEAGKLRVRVKDLDAYAESLPVAG